MKQAEAFFQGAGNVRIYRQCWLPATPCVTVVLVHGLGEHSGRYRHVAQALTDIGCAVYTLDHRGHGKSEGPRAFIDRFSNAVADIDTVVDFAAREQGIEPGKGKLFLLGHSMGGALSLSYTLKHAGKLAGLILSGPAIAFDNAPPFMGPISKFLAAVAPKLGIFAVDPKVVSRDPDTVADYAADPLNHHGKAPARTIGEIVKFAEWLPGAAPMIELPLLAMHGSEDRLAGPSGSRSLVELAGSKDKTLKIYDGLYHEIFNELPADRARVLANLTGWIEARI